MSEGKKKKSTKERKSPKSPVPATQSKRVRSAETDFMVSIEHASFYRKLIRYCSIFGMIIKTCRHIRII